MAGQSDYAKSIIEYKLKEKEDKFKSGMDEVRRRTKLASQFMSFKEKEEAQAEKEKAKESGQAVTKTPGYSTPAKIGPGGDGAMDGIEGHGLSLAGLVGGGGQQGPGSTTTSAVSEDGRTMTDTRTTNNPTNLLQGRLGPLNLIPGLSEMFTKDNISTDTVTGPNPEFKKRIADTTASVGEQIFRVNNGNMRPDAFVKALQGDLKDFNKAEQAQIMQGAQQVGREKTASQNQLDRVRGQEFGIRFAENGVPNGKIALDIANAKSDTELTDGLTRYQKALHSTDEAVRGRAVQSVIDATAQLTLEKTRMALETTQLNRAIALRKSERDGIFGAIGLKSDLTDSQLIIRRKEAFEDKKGTLVYTEGKLPTYVGLAKAAVAKWQPVEMLLPKSSGRFDIMEPNDAQIVRFDPQEAYNPHYLVLSNTGFDKNGKPTGDPSEVDFARTALMKDSAIKFFNDTGMFEAYPPGEGETEATLAVVPGHQYASMAADWESVSEYAVQMGLNRNQTVLNPSELVAERGATQVEMEGSAPTPQPVPPTFAEGFQGAFRKHRQEQFSQKIEGAKTDREKKLEALSRLNFPQVTLGQ